MSWDVVVRAVLVFDTAGLAKWPAQKLRAVTRPESLPAAKLECTTVGAALAMLEKRATYSRVTTKKGTWTLWALLSRDDYDLHLPTFLAAVARAGTLSATGEALFYGFSTGPAGMAHRVVVGPELAITKLSKTEEKKLLATHDAKAFGAWIESLVQADEAARGKALARERSLAPSKFFEDMKGVRSVIEDAMAFIQRSDDKALAKVVSAGEFDDFYARDFKTGARIKKACTPASSSEDPNDAASGMLGIVNALDPVAGEALCARLLDADDMPDVLRRTSTRILHRTAHAPRVVERLTFRGDGTYGTQHHSFYVLEEWAGYLGDAPEIANELLEQRLRAQLRAAEKDEGAAQAAHYLAAALLMKRKAWSVVPLLAKACFEHPDVSVRNTIAQLFDIVRLPVAIVAPRLDALVKDRKSRGEVLVYELCRRLRSDPSGAFDELEALLLANERDASQAVAYVLGPSETWRESKMTPAEQNAVFAAEPRWKKFRRGVVAVT